MIDISGLPKASLLAALYNGARAQGAGFMRYDPRPMTIEEAEKVLQEQGYDYDYLRGRVMKINLEGEEMDEFYYDRDNGDGVAEYIIYVLRNTGDPTHRDIVDHHKAETIKALKRVREIRHEPTSQTFDDELGIEVIRLGGDFLPDGIDEALDRAEKDLND